MRAALWFLGAVVVGLVVFEIAMQPTESERLHLGAIFIAVAGLAAIGAVVVGAIVRHSRSIRQSVLAASIGGLVVVGAAMAFAAQQMFFSAHDLSLLLVVLVFAGVTAVGFSVLVERAVTKDLEATAAAARGIEGGDLSARTGVERPDEIGTVAATFDAMAGELERRAAEREADEAARRRFLAAIGHDLRTPLASLQAAIEALEDGLAPDPDRYLRSMERDVSALGSLVDDLFLLAKLEEGSITVERGAIDVTELADEAIEVLTPVAASRDIRLELDADQRTIASGGSEAVSRVLRNLVDNAIRFAPAGSAVLIEVRDDDGAQVRVLDEGPGFDPDFVDHAFEHFTRDDPARERSTGGSGLGLAIAHGFVEALDGTIWAEPGPGGRVGFRLPAA